MDFKNCREKYALTTGISESSAAILYESTLLSADFIKKSGVEYEFRTTVVKQFHTVEDIRAIARTLAGVPKYFLQCFEDSGDILGGEFTACSKDTMNEMLAAAREFVPNTQLRGM